MLVNIVAVRDANVLSSTNKITLTLYRERGGFKRIVKKYIISTGVIYRIKICVGMN